MIEIALCLGIIGFALVVIIGVLPGGMNTQRDTREETIVDQDATMLIEAVRSGARGMDDLTNYVFAITNTWDTFKVSGAHNAHGANGYTFSMASLNGVPAAYDRLTNGMRIVGLLSTPEFTSLNGEPISSTFNTTYQSNHIVAYVRSLSGLAVEKPPQDNQIMQEDTFSYRLIVVNAPLAADTNVLQYPGYTRQLAGGFRDLRLLFTWPLLPNGTLAGRNFYQTFRTSIAGQLVLTNDRAGMGPLYLYQSQSFTNAP
jgi:type II secretory pathway pseudopilin PulG